MLYFLCVKEASIIYSFKQSRYLLKNIHYLAKLGDGLDESPTVMVGEKRENRVILKPSWAFVETKRY